MAFRMVVLFSALLVATVCGTPVKNNLLTRSGSASRVDGDYRLPNNSVPISYLVKLTPYIVEDNFTFDGEASIVLQVLEQSTTITLHTNALTYNEALTTVESQDGVNYTVVDHTYVTDEHFLVLEFNSALPPGNYTLNFTYVGILDNDMRGFYRSSYTNASGDTVWLATTQFEPTHARRAFPCYDEPALKATWDIWIKHEAGLRALSNMPIISNTTDSTDGKVWTVFETTPLISSYLIAFVVSDFLSIESANGTFNVWARPNAISFVQYALDIGAVELADLEEFTSIPYSLPKMDQISIPDFSAGAMENWGLVTYRESMFHWQENVTTTSTKQTIAAVISHEFGHQWFGNLVSPQWWTYLWLNEGFATYFEYYTTDQAEDNWRMMEQFAIKEQQAYAFVADASAYSHPMNYYVSSPSEISSTFDNIAYAKAGCVIRMMSNFLSEDVFKAGLTKYLNNRAYAAATPDDLFEALQEAEDDAYILPLHVYVKEVMATWTEQMGYPVLTVTRNYTTGTAEVAQERFLLGDADPTDTHDYKWWIPFNWATQGNLNFNTTLAYDWIRSQDDSVMLSGFESSEWIIFNNQQTGYYRVNYDDTNWGLIASYLKTTNYQNIHVVNRAQIIDDTLNLARADHLSYSVVLNVLAYLEQELDYVPWYAAFTGFSFLNRQLANTDNYESIRTFLAQLATNVYESVGVYESADEEHATLLNRINAITNACNYGVASCRTDTHNRLLSWLDDPEGSALPRNLLTSVSCAGIRTANATTWTRLWNLYLSSTDSTVQTAILAALGCSEDADIINNWMSMIFNSSSGLPSSSASTAFAYIYQGSYNNIDLALDFVIDNLDLIISYSGNTSVQTFLTNIGYRLTTQSQLNKLNAFAAAQSNSLGSSAVTGISYAVSNVAWTAKYELEISTWIRSALGESIDYRLPNNSVPISYDIELIPYIVVDNFTFDGKSSIWLRVVETTTELTLHSNSITYDETLTTLVSDAGVTYPVASHSYDTTRHFLVIGFGTALPVGNYTLNLTFVGILSSATNGFYRSSYTNDNGDTVWLATTQFEATYARQAFPCYDEPALKATFDIAIKHDASLHALSNMPIISNTTDAADGKVWTVFDTSPIMSTYLVAFVVSDFASLQSLNGTFNVWSRPNAISWTQYALDVGALELADLAEWTGVPYALPKMDQISIPDFASGAMENWGLVTYRESYFYWQQNVTTLATKQNIAAVISHEFAHQWFGNLVGPYWWKYLWLNEGFATYFQYYTTDEVEEDWRMMEQFLVRVVQGTAFVTDAASTSHPMNNDVESPTEIRATFDNIAYSKAGSVIRMMSHFLSEDVFKAGITSYLNNMAYGAATSDDLFEALHEAEDAAGILPYHVYVPEIMETWVEQAGYPVVTVTRNYTTGTTEISQERFILGDADETDDHDYKWWIPINWATQANLNFSTTLAYDWIRSQDDSIMISGFTSGLWVIFNIQQTGYYRVNYDDTNWGLIADYLKTASFENIHVLNRAQIVDDTLNLARADRLSYSVALNVLAYLEQELDYIPWYAAFNGFSYLNRVLANTDNYEAIKEFFALLTTNVYDSVGITEAADDSHTTLLNRVNVITYACNFGVTKCRTDAHDRVLTWLDDPEANALPTNLRTAISCAGVRTANSTTWNRVWNLYLTSTDSTERTAILAALGCSENEEIIDNWMSMIINASSGLQSSDASSAFTYVYTGSHYNVDRAFDFIVNNLDSIISFFGSVTSVQTFLTGIGNRMTTQSQLDKLNAFASGQSATLNNAAASGISNAEANVEWTAKYESEISSWILSAVNSTDVDYRLPSNSVPISYNIKLTSSITADNFTFAGESSIVLQVSETTTTLTLHTYELTYDESLTSLVSEAGVAYSVVSHSYNTETDFLVIRFSTALPVGNYTLNLTYVGTLRSDMYGFYRSSYTNDAGDTVWLATTQFEPTFARRAFPCYDEPALKATFDISLKHDANLHALSNMPVVSNTTDTSDGTVLTVFETTPIMSTYLVAFVISDYASLQSLNGTFNVWSRPNAIAYARYALEIGTLELADLEEWTSIPYALPKMDQISIPDFAFGAMENWGLVTYRETRLLWQENVTTITEKQSIAAVISHEFAHQWFGNLVTPSWWEYIWLNEGFATYFQYYTTDEAEDNWRMMEQFLVRVVQATAFVTDASATVRPMNHDAQTPSEILALLDNIAYSKAASVIRMMRHFLSEDVFKAGITSYLNKMAYQAAVPDDLFQALHEVEDAAGILPYHVYVPEIMETWVEQAGYPVVTVTRNYTTGTTEISQERFILGDADETDDHDYKWWIPINWATQANLNFSTTLAYDWIRSQDDSIMISGFTSGLWVIFNIQQTGYYRVNYDDTNWGMIANYLKTANYQNIHVLNRAQIVDDTLNLARADRLSYSVALNVLAYLEQELDYIPWYSAFNGFSYLNRVLANTDNYEAIKEFFALLTTNVYDSVGITEAADDSHTTLLNRISVITYACNFGVTKCRTDAHDRVLTWLDDPEANALPTNLRTAISCAGVRTANSTTWNRVWNLYLTSTDSTERTAILAALGCSENEEIIDNWMSMIINASSGLQSSDASSAFTYVYTGSHYNVDRAFDFIVSNLDRIVSFFGSITSVQTFLTGIGNRMTTQAQLNRLNAFAAAQSSVLGSVAQTGIANAESNVEWTDKYEPEISEWILSLLDTDSDDTTSATEATTLITEATTLITEDTTLITEDTTVLTTEQTTSATESDETTTPTSSATVITLSYMVFSCLFLFARFI